MKDHIPPSQERMEVTRDLLCLFTTEGFMKFIEKLKKIRFVEPSKFRKMKNDIIDETFSKYSFL